MSGCKPHLSIVMSAVTTTALQLVINRSLVTLGGNEPFCLRIAKDQVPLFDITTTPPTLLALPVVLVDPQATQTTTPCFLGCTGNILRSDQLHHFLRRNADGRCCDFNFCCFYGADSPHVTFHQRMCPSRISISTVGTLAN